jgi:hypothetical protein
MRKGLFGRAPAPKNQLQLRLLKWRGFFMELKLFEENVWQNSFV